MGLHPTRIKGQSQSRRGASMEPDTDPGMDNDQTVSLSPDELHELEVALAENQAGKVISGEDFLRRLREPLDRSASS